MRRSATSRFRFPPMTDTLPAEEFLFPWLGGQAVGRSAEVREGTKQLAHAVPHDLYPDANQQERGEFNDHVGTGRSEYSCQTVRTGIAEIDRRRHDSGTNSCSQNREHACPEAVRLICAQ